jgi:hypothetical protein
MELISNAYIALQSYPVNVFHIVSGALPVTECLKTIYNVWLTI